MRIHLAGVKRVFVLCAAQLLPCDDHFDEAVGSYFLYQAVAYQLQVKRSSAARSAKVSQRGGRSSNGPRPKRKGKYLEVLLKEGRRARSDDDVLDRVRTVFKTGEASSRGRSTPTSRRSKAVGKQSTEDAGVGDENEKKDVEDGVLEDESFVQVQDNDNMEPEESFAPLPPTADESSDHRRNTASGEGSEESIEGFLEYAEKQADGSKPSEGRVPREQSGPPGEGSSAKSRSREFLQDPEYQKRKPSHGREEGAVIPERDDTTSPRNIHHGKPTDFAEIHHGNQRQGGHEGGDANTEKDDQMKKYGCFDGSGTKMEGKFCHRSRKYCEDECDGQWRADGLSITAIGLIVGASVLILIVVIAIVARYTCCNPDKEVGSSEEQTERELEKRYGLNEGVLGGMVQDNQPNSYREQRKPLSGVVDKDQYKRMKEDGTLDSEENRGTKFKNVYAMDEKGGITAAEAAANADENDPQGRSGGVKSRREATSANASASKPTQPGEPSAPVAAKASAGATATAGGKAGPGAETEPGAPTPKAGQADGTKDEGAEEMKQEKTSEETPKGEKRATIGESIMNFFGYGGGDEKEKVSDVDNKDKKTTGSGERRSSAKNSDDSGEKRSTGKSTDDAVEKRSIGRSSEISGGRDSSNLAGAPRDESGGGRRQSRGLSPRGSRISQGPKQPPEGGDASSPSKRV